MLGNVCSTEEDVCFFFLLGIGCTSTGREVLFSDHLFLCFCNPPQQEYSVFFASQVAQRPVVCEVRGSAEYNHVATVDYSNPARDGAGGEVCMTAQANRGMGSNKAGLLSDLPPTDPVCLCGFMATV